MTARLLTVYAVYLMAAMSPGPSVVYVMRTSVGSRGHGRAAALGVATGTTLWVLAAALGLAAALKSAPHLMAAIRGIGGLYFLYLAGKLGLSAARARGDAAPRLTARSARAAYAQGVAVNATNPSAALFFTALLGLYDVPAMPRPAQLAAYLGIPLLSASWYCGLSFVFSDARMSRAYLGLRRPLDGALAALFVFLGLKLVLSVY